MATSKALRQAPQKILDNYVVSINKIFGEPSTRPDVDFLSKGEILIPATTSGAGSTVLTSSIGFEVELNGKTYKDFSVSDAGWLFLRDPVTGSVGNKFFYDVIYNPSAPPNQANEYSNEFILPNFAYDHILLAPWFGTDLQQIATTVDTLQAGPYSGVITNALKSEIEQGASTKNWPYDIYDAGVRKLNGFDSKKGRYLLVRWTMASSYYKYKFKFEVALYENSSIEYRYWPLGYYEPTTTSFIPSIEVTVGGFWSGPSTGANKFRDLSTLLDYRRGERNMSLLGGATYINSFTEAKTSAYRNAPYAVKIPVTNWPKNGAVITLTPPVNPAKFLPRKLTSIISSAKEIVRSPGLFDDRKSINFITGTVVDLPSNLPSRLFGDTSSANVALQQLLFTSGSILTTGNINKSVFDSAQSQLNALESLVSPADFSFNESQKNYEATSALSGFYATGSALEIFGEGFTAPLKSKTQFTFSLPVSKKVAMPPSTSSFYYYDADREQWARITPNNNDPAPMIAATGATYKELQILENFGSGAFSDYLHRVTETSFGFDPVGRKVVSGSKFIDFSAIATGVPTYQTDRAIGMIFNTNLEANAAYGSGLYGDPDVIDTAIIREYRKTITDNSGAYPSESQRIKLPIDYPFLIEKVVVDIPLYISGEWFNDLTTCTRAFGNDIIIASTAAQGVPSGAIDFGGPGITFAMMCPRKNGSFGYLDLIASGTITHANDNTGSVVLYKDPEMNYYCMRPVGFKAFSNPTTVISGINNIFDGKVRLEMEASIAGGITLARNDRSLLSGSKAAGGPTGPNTTTAFAVSNREKAIQLLTTQTFFTRGEKPYNLEDNVNQATELNVTRYSNRAPRIYIQQVSPISRGRTGMEFCGNSILGGNIAQYNLEERVRNPLYYSSSSSLPSEFTTKINGPNFFFEAVSIYSTVDSKPAPYLVLPGDSLTFSISKTRSAIYKAIWNQSIAGTFDAYTGYQLTGSHGTVLLNTGSIDITVYGSYVREGMEYHP